MIPCPIQATPMEKTPTGGATVQSRILAFLSNGTKESIRRLIAYRCVMVLLLIACSMTSVVCYQGMNFKPVDNGLMTGLTFIIGIIAALAREVFHRKPDTDQTNSVQP